jgi:hypothetical protein
MWRLVKFLIVGNLVWYVILSCINAEFNIAEWEMLHYWWGRVIAILVEIFIITRSLDNA